METDFGSRLRAFARRRAESPALTSAFAALAVATLVAGVIGVELVHPLYAVNPGARGALETAMILAALTSVSLLVVNFSHGRRLRDLLLLCAVVSAVTTDVTYSAAPALRGAVGLEPGGGARLVCNLLVALAFAAAAVAPRRTIDGSPRKLVTLAAVAGAGSVVLSLLLRQLVEAHSQSGVLRATGIAAAASHPAALTVQTASAAVLVISGFVFVVRCRRGEMDAWLLGAAAFLLAGALLQYLALPAVGSDWVTPRDGLRLGGFALLLWVAYRQFTHARRHEAFAALCAERERIARDLHDGLAQDLAYITMQGQRLGSEVGPEHPVMVAARRALAGARGAIADLTAADASSAEAAFQRIADELGCRYDLQVNVNVRWDRSSMARGELEPQEREHLVRIVREAIVNAALHGAARHVEVSLEYRTRGFLLSISDDGVGIADAERVGFGLRTMRARAASLGGVLTARPRPGGGTLVELLVRERQPSLEARPAPGAMPAAAHAWPTRRAHVHRRIALAGKRKLSLRRIA